MPDILLTGAGFSRNWGGWLADEVFDYLLGCPEMNEDIRIAIWSAKNSNYGFACELLMRGIAMIALLTTLNCSSKCS
jgi:hypothetical protein